MQILTWGNSAFLTSCPKTTLVSKKIVQIAVSSAANNFNSTVLGLSDIFHDLELTAGQCF